MAEERKISKWDRRRANKRLKRFMKKNKDDTTIKNVDAVHVRLPELNEKQRDTLDKDIKSKKNVKIDHVE